MLYHWSILIINQILTIFRKDGILSVCSNYKYLWWYLNFLSSYVFYLSHFIQLERYLWPAGYCLIAGLAWQRHFPDNLFVSICETRVIITANDPKEHISKTRGCKFDSFSTLPGFVRGYAAVSISGPLIRQRNPLLARGGNQRKTRRYNRQGKFEKSFVSLEFLWLSYST